MNYPASPVVIIGMHRSGTSMITRLLQEFGLFMGWRREINDEALFFLRLNDWLLSQAGARWDVPEPLKWFWQDDACQGLVESYFRAGLAQPKTLSFLGWQRWLRSRDITAIEGPWGWKDPRNSLTLPLWLKIFPDMRVVHITRHGVDVADSLRVRRDRNVRKWQKDLPEKLLRYSLLDKRKPFVETLRCGHLEEGVKLWAHYLEVSHAHVQALGTDRAMEFAYEDFLSDPAPLLRQMADFCRLEVSEAQIAEGASRVKPERAFAYRNDPELPEFARSVAPTLERFGYSAE